MQPDKGQKSATAASLNRRGVMGGAWVAALQGVMQLVSLARVVVLARLLAPEDFGLFAIAMLTMGLLEMLSRSGVEQALIQKKGDIGAYLDTAWTIQVIRGALLAGCLLAVTPWIAAFFEQPDVVSLIRPLALVMFLNGLVNIKVVEFQRTLEFHKDFFYQLVPVLMDFCVAIAAAVYLRDPIAMVYGLIARSAVTIVASYVFCPEIRRIRIKAAQVRELFSFGKWIFIFGILVYVINQLDRAVVGKLLGTTDLGYYQMAFLIGTLVASQLNTMIGRVAFPLYSRLRHEDIDLRSAYLAVLDACCIIIFPVTFAVIVFSHDLTVLLVGQKWLPMVPVLQLMALKGMIWALAAATGASIYFAFGRPDINVKINLVQLVILGLFIYPFALHYGIVGVAILSVISIMASYILNVGVSARFTGVTVRAYLAVLTGPFLGAAASAAVAYAFYAVMPWQGVGGFLLSMLLMMASYATWLMVSGRYRLATKLLSIIRSGNDKLRD